MKEITSELAASIDKRLASDEVKEMIEETKSASDNGTFKVVITTENLDRYDEVISLDGWDLEHYMKNPVVLWGHDHNRIIGVATNVYRDDGKLIAEGKFAPTEEGQEKRKLYDEGFLKATSVGFISKEREGNLITKAELIEFSFVSVPANPYALALALEKERSVDELITKGIFKIEQKDADEVEAEDDAPADADEEDTSGEKELKEKGGKGAVSDELADQEAREKKWKNFSKVDDVVWSMWKVYFDDKTPVDDFEKLLSETIEILSKISAGEKDFELTGDIKEIESAPQFLARVALSLAIKDGALEDEAPERTDDEGDDDEDPEVKEFELKKQVQALDTFLGDYLAEKRQGA